MSHFSVLVLTRSPNDLEAAMAPFQENNMGDCPEEFLAFNDTEDENREEWQTCSVTRWKAPDGSLHSDSEDVFYRPASATEAEEIRTRRGLRTPAFAKLGWRRSGDQISIKEVPAGFVQVEVPAREIWPDFDDYMAAYAGAERDEKTGRYGYWENPNAKWDYWTLGGRWSRMLVARKDAAVSIGAMGRIVSGTAKENAQVDQCRIRDLDIPAMILAVQEARAKEWDGIQELDEALREQLYDITPDMTKEDHVNRPITPISAFAVLKDGVWYEQGRMGWWGMVADEQDQESWDARIRELLGEVDPDTWISVVDCHI